MGYSDNTMIWCGWFVFFTLFDIGFGILLFEPQIFDGNQAVFFLIWSIAFSSFLVIHAATVENFQAHILQKDVQAKITLVQLGSFAIAALILLFTYAEHYLEKVFLVFLLLSMFVFIKNYEDYYSFMVEES